jgi:hypothetical protein
MSDQSGEPKEEKRKKASDLPRPKPYDERPYVWCSRQALETIQRTAGYGPEVSYLTSAYIALCRLSSERKNLSNIRTQITVIAGFIGLRYRKTQQLLADLESKAKVIQTFQPDGDPGGQMYIILKLRTHAQPCRGSKSKPLHSDAGDPCTDLPSNRADSLKRKKKKKAQRKRQRSFSFSGGNKNRAHSKPGLTPDGTAALPAPITQKEKVPAPTTGGITESDFYNVDKWQAKIESGISQGNVVSQQMADSLSHYPCSKCTKHVLMLQQIGFQKFKGNVLCEDCRGL